MKVKTDFPVKIREYAKQNEQRLAAFKKEVEINAQKARDYAFKVLLNKTPHAGDGKERGPGMIGTSGTSLRDSWHMEYVLSAKSEGQDGELATITITNDKPYAPFVEHGHRLTKHFVPWLYINSSGLLSRETNQNQPLFGLTVGGKTPFVKGVGMVEKAMKAFDTRFNKLNRESMFKLFIQDQFKIIFNYF